MAQALAGVTLLQFRQVQPGKVVDIAGDDGGANGIGQAVKRVLKGKHQTVVERVALGRARQADHSDFIVGALNVELNVVGCHGLDFLNG